MHMSRGFNSVLVPVGVEADIFAREEHMAKKTPSFCQAHCSAKRLETILSAMGRLKSENGGAFDVYGATAIQGRSLLQKSPF